MLDSTGKFCYDGIDSSFDQSLYSCEGDEVGLLLEDLDFHWGISSGFNDSNSKLDSGLYFD